MQLSSAFAILLSLNYAMLHLLNKKRPSTIKQTDASHLYLMKKENLEYHFDEMGCFPSLSLKYD